MECHIGPSRAGCQSWHMILNIASKVRDIEFCVAFLYTFEKCSCKIALQIEKQLISFQKMFNSQKLVKFQKCYGCFILAGSVRKNGNFESAACKQCGYGKTGLTIFPITSPFFNGFWIFLLIMKLCFPTGVRGELWTQKSCLFYEFLSH